MGSLRLGFLLPDALPDTNPYLGGDYQLTIHLCIQPLAERGNAIVFTVKILYLIAFRKSSVLLVDLFSANYTSMYSTPG